MRSKVRCLQRGCITHETAKAARVRCPVSLIVLLNQRAPHPLGLRIYSVPNAAEIYVWWVRTLSALPGGGG